MFPRMPCTPCTKKSFPALESHTRFGDCVKLGVASERHKTTQKGMVPRNIQKKRCCHISQARHPTCCKLDRTTSFHLRKKPFHFKERQLIKFICQSGPRHPSRTGGYGSKPKQVSWQPSHLENTCTKRKKSPKALKQSRKDVKNLAHTWCADSCRKPKERQETRQWTLVMSWF